MRSPGKLLLLVALLASTSVLAGERFRVKARLLTGAPASVNYRHTDVASRGVYSAKLVSEEVVADLNFLRRVQKPAVGETVADIVNETGKSKRTRKVFGSSEKDVATTADARRVDAAPVRLDDIRLTAYSDGPVHFTGRLRELPIAAANSATIKERTDGCRVTILVRGYGATESASTDVLPNGPLLFECSQSFWMSKGDDCAISLICPEDSRFCGSHYPELTHLEVEVEARRNR